MRGGPRSAIRLRLLPRTDVSAVRSCDAIATSSNVALVGEANPNFWRFAGKRSADGALHRAAGPRLLAACEDIAPIGNRRCGIGEAVVTPAFDLHAAYVIHAVAPDSLYGGSQQPWQGSGSKGARAASFEDAPPLGDATQMLARTYRAILAGAVNHSVGSVAMPAVGAGIQGFAPGLTAKVALGALRAHAATQTGDGLRVDVALLDDATFNAWSRTTRAMLGLPTSTGPDGVELYDVVDDVSDVSCAAGDA